MMIGHAIFQVANLMTERAPDFQARGQRHCSHRHPGPQGGSDGMEADGGDHRGPADQPRQGRPDTAGQRGSVPGAWHADYEEAGPAGRLCHQVQGQLSVKPHAGSETAAAGYFVSLGKKGDGDDGGCAK